MRVIQNQNTSQQNYDRRAFLKLISVGASSLALSSFLKCRKQYTNRFPNFVIIFTDDQGYADIGCFGALGFSTPNLDQMAEEGMRFTNFYVASSVCTPSRAALLTGCYPQRIDLPNVLFPEGPTRPKEITHIGLNSKETTIAELLKPLGYTTACFGKWHLGHLPPFLPTRHGFDEYFGLPYSNDMRPEKDKPYPDLPLMEGEEIIQYNPDQTQLTTWYTEHALKFIERNKDRPFFLYIPHTMPHVPLYVSEKFRGHSPQGLYGDVMMEIDWSVGQILTKLKKLDLDHNTLVIFTSDNGPWLKYGEHAGSAQPLREGKMTTFEGGQRVPCIMRWPGKIPAGSVCHKLSTTMDILPTIAVLTDATLPSLPIDGKNIWPLISNQPDVKSPYEAFYFFRGNHLQAVRSDRWKMHFPHTYISLIEGDLDGKIGKTEGKNTELVLYDLEHDIGESTNVAEKYPEVVKRLSDLAKKFDTELKQNIRPAGTLI